MRIDPPVNWDIRWVYEDAQRMVIDKPADLPVHSSGSYRTHTLEALLKKYRPGNTIHLVSRLDRETSGLCLVAKDPVTAARMGRIPKRKCYHVLVEGDFPYEQICAVGSIQRSNRPPVYSKRDFLSITLHKTRVTELPNLFNVAATWFERLGEGPWQGTTLLRAELLTGRTHQIRASLCAMGYPVVGDKIYGLDAECFLRFREDRLTAEDKQLLRLPNQALRAVELSFEGMTFHTVRPPWSQRDTW